MAAAVRSRANRRASRRERALATASCALLGLVLVACQSPPPTGPPAAPELPETSPTAPFPDATSTGVPEGTRLTPSGPLDIRRAGTVIDGLDIDGCVDVRADDVTIRRSRITCRRPTTAVRLFDGHSGLLVEDVEIDGTGVVSTAVGFAGYALLRVDIHSVIDGPRLGSGTAIQDSYVHGLTRVQDSHNDAVQITGGSGIVIRHNTLSAVAESTGDLLNAAVMIGSQSAPVRDVLIEGNYLDGGNYTVNFHPDLVAEGIVLRDNVFGPHHRYGPVARGDAPGVEWSGPPVMSSPGPTRDGQGK